MSFMDIMWAGMIVANVACFAFLLWKRAAIPILVCQGFSASASVLMPLLQHHYTAFVNCDYAIRFICSMLEIWVVAVALRRSGWTQAQNMFLAAVIFLHQEIKAETLLLCVPFAPDDAENSSVILYRKILNLAVMAAFCLVPYIGRDVSTSEEDENGRNEAYPRSPNAY